MRLPIEHIEIPCSLACQIAGVIASIGGIIATTIYGAFNRMAVLSPEELAIQPLHVILILFIVALAAFIVLILRTVWGKGVETVNRFSESNERIADQMQGMILAIKDMADVQSNRLAKLEELSFEALKEATASKASK